MQLAELQQHSDFLQTSCRSQIVLSWQPIQHHGCVWVGRVVQRLDLMAQPSLQTDTKAAGQRTMSVPGEAAATAAVAEPDGEFAAVAAAAVALGVVGAGRLEPVNSAAVAASASSSAAAWQETAAVAEE